jgi:membrane fusion protein (multidrug efflux system)
MEPNEKNIKTQHGNKQPGNGNNRLPLIIGAVAVLLVILGVWVARSFFNQESTDDAFIDGHVILISPKVSGQIAKVYVADNQEVRAGEPLFDIDERDYAVRLELAQADVKGAVAELSQASQDATRYKDLRSTGDISQQEFDRAVLRLQTAQAKLDGAKARLEQAELDLSYTKVKAPEAGQVARKAVEPGAYVQEGQVLLAMVTPERWVTANMKETQMTHIQPGMPVTIAVDAYPGKVFHGHVDSIQQGTGSRFSLLPAENATGNFIKVVQRVPVKIVFDDQPDPDEPLALGLSVVPTIKLK